MTLATVQFCSILFSLSVFWCVFCQFSHIVLQSLIHLWPECLPCRGRLARVYARASCPRSRLRPGRLGTAFGRTGCAVYPYPARPFLCAQTCPQNRGTKHSRGQKYSPAARKGILAGREKNTASPSSIPLDAPVSAHKSAPPPVCADRISMDVPCKTRGQLWLTQLRPATKPHLAWRPLICDIGVRRTYSDLSRFIRCWTLRMTTNQKPGGCFRVVVVVDRRGRRRRAHGTRPS